ncbi:cullin-2-like isoform X1 [Haemaphysalis longicornis]
MSLKPKRIDFEGTWEQLRDTVAGVITLAKVPRPIWNDRFSDVYALCVAFPEPLGDRLYLETKKFLNAHVQHLYELVVSGDDLLGGYYQHWLQYSQGIDYLNKLYMYLNTQHIKKHKLSEADLSYGSAEPSEQLLEVGELGLELWRRNMVQPLRPTLVSLLLQALARDRQEGQCPHQRTVQGAILSLVQVDAYRRKAPLALYQELFEGPFLAETGRALQREAHRLLERCDCSAYMERVLHCLAQESLRAHRFLHPSSYPKVTRECEQQMVGAHLGFLQQECGPMMEAERRTDLARMYTLLRPLGPRALEGLVSQLQRHVEGVGLSRLQQQPSADQPSSSASPPPPEGGPCPVSPQHFVEAVLQVHATYQDMVREVFQGDQQFVGALDKACATIINNRGTAKQPCRSPELLAKYCDALLKKSAKGISESEVEDKLTQSITVFKYIDDKDVFQKFYAKMLAKRLIHSQSMSMDVEEAMINKLKQACGYEFTSKLHRMFTDMSVSADLNNKFSSYLKAENIELGINFSIYVLQAGAWPLGQSAVSPFAIPLELERSVQKFEHFYQSKFSGRKLSWLQHLCQAEVRLCYLRRSYLVSLGTYQMALLLPFEGADALCVRDLAEATRLAPDQLHRQLQGLLDARLLLLLPPQGQEQGQEQGPGEGQHGPLGPDTVLHLNKAYSNKRTKFKISAVLQKEAAQQELEQTHSSVDEDRKLYLQAAVVRIMKARKLLRHNTLIQEVISQAKSRFVPSVAMIKKCIEALIDKQYLERTPNSTDEYCYVA